MRGFLTKEFRVGYVEHDVGLLPEWVAVYLSLLYRDECLGLTHIESNDGERRGWR